MGNLLIIKKNMHHITPALEFMRQDQQREQLQYLLETQREYKNPTDFLFQLMRLPVDMYSMVLFRKNYRDIKEDVGGPDRIRQLRMTARLHYDRVIKLYRSLFAQKDYVGIAGGHYSEQEMLERFDASTFKAFWFTLTFNFLPGAENVKGDEVRQFHRISIFPIPHKVLVMAKDVNHILRMNALRISKEFMEMPEHVRGMLLVRSKRIA